MSPAPRALWIATGLAVALLMVPAPVVLVAATLLAGAVLADALAARRVRSVTRTMPAVVARGVPGSLRVVVDAEPGVRVAVRQPRVPEVAVEPGTAEGGLDARLVVSRRGRHTLPPVVVRATGPLGLGRWDRTWGTADDLLAYPDLPAARRIATAVRTGRFRDPGARIRGPLGIGTEFESVRDYVPDDDIRQVNWLATARHRRPMSNQYREDTERDVLAVVDCGRLMTSPVGDRTRLDAALDALAALAAVADAVGDRIGVVAYDDAVRLRLAPKRANGEAVVRATYDLEPRPVDSDPGLAFRSLATKRSLVVVFTDLIEEAAARPLLDAAPVLARRHAVVLASVRDTDLVAAASAPPTSAHDVYAGVVAAELLAARDAVVGDLARRGVRTVDAPAAGLAAAVVGAYLDAKARARL